MKNASPFICGTVILTISNFLSRLIGFYNRIFLAGMIGAHQIGIYQLIFPVYLLGFAVCFQGFQIALSKITAEKKAAGIVDAAKTTLRLTILLTMVLCFIFSFFCFVYADKICTVFLHEPACVPCLRLAVLVLPFVGVKNCIHGYCLCPRTFFVFRTNFSGFFHFFTFYILDRKNASCCIPCCLWNGCR